MSPKQAEKKPFESVERKRARQAWEAVSTFEKTVEGDQWNQYRSLIRNFPAMVQSMGIGASLAFLQAKSKKNGPHRTLLEQLRSWTFGDKAPIPWTTDSRKYPNNIHGLLCRLMDEPKGEAPESAERLGLEQAIWWAAEDEVLAYAVWLKRFTESFEKEDSEKDSGEKSDVEEEKVEDAEG